MYEARERKRISFVFPFLREKFHQTLVFLFQTIPDLQTHKKNKKNEPTRNKSAKPVEQLGQAEHRELGELCSLSSLQLRWDCD